MLSAIRVNATTITTALVETMTVESKRISHSIKIRALCLKLYETRENYKYVPVEHGETESRAELRMSELSGSCPNERKMTSELEQKVMFSSLFILCLLLVRDQAK
jgi:hypothetical protein